SCPEGGGITVKKCQDILSEVFVRQTHVLEGFHRFLEGRHIFAQQDCQDAASFFGRVKASGRVSKKDFNDLLATLSQCMVQNTKVEDICRKVNRALRRCPDFIQTFETYLPGHRRVPPPSEQTYRRTTTSPTDK
ncbi:hypothetical protein U9M48_045032, partial [Paspalum notatum var. saurae]